MFFVLLGHICWSCRSNCSEKKHPLLLLLGVHLHAKTCTTLLDFNRRHSCNSVFLMQLLVLCPLWLLRLRPPTKSIFTPWKTLWPADPSLRRSPQLKVSFCGKFRFVFIFPASWHLISLRHPTRRHQPASPRPHLGRERLRHHPDVALKDRGHLRLPNWGHAYFPARRLCTHSEKH